MKLHTLIFFCLFLFVANSQPNTEIVLFDLETLPQITLSNFKNISNNPGYDNQPSFLSDSRILFSSTRKGQTDIAQYFADYNSKIWINFTEGGEYSPQKVPSKNEVSAVRLDPDGKQGLYVYNLSNGESRPLITDKVVAYYTWANEYTIVSAVIENESLNLYVSDIEKGTHIKYADNVGRSFHHIPDTDLISFISKSTENQWQIKSINPLSGKIRTVANTMTDSEDICWLNKKTILAGKDGVLYKLTLQKDNNWKTVADLSSFGIKSISRLSVNPSANKLAMAVELVKSPQEDTKEEEESTGDTTTESTTISDAEAIVQKQLDAYNKRDIDAFMATYSQDIKLYNYPNELRTEGQEQMRKSYEQWFNRVPDLRAFIKKRIVIGNKVIDEEQVTANGQIFNAVAIYEVENGLISKVTFIQ